MNSFGFPNQTKSQRIGRKGVAFFDHFVTDTLGWIFRQVPQESDYGIDGYVDIVVDGNVTGQNLAVQIKCGDSYTSKLTSGGIRYDGVNKHLNYYLNQINTIILIVLNENCDQCYWSQFDVEKTTKSKQGWWIEIPKANALQSNTRIDWLEIVGQAEDFSESIQQQWTIDDVIDLREFMVFSIPKEDVLTCSMSYIERIIKRLSKNRDLMLKKRGTVEIFFPEYDDDPREIYQIPEIRKWFSVSLKAGIPWFYFLSTRGEVCGLILLLFCTNDITVKEIRDDGHVLEISVKDHATWIEENFHNLNMFAELNSIPDEINKEISEAITNLLFKELEWLKIKD